MARVFHLTYSLDFGGVESQLRLLAECLGKRDEHSFVALRSGGDVSQAIEMLGCPVYILGVDPWKSPLATIRSLLRIFRDERPDILHAHGLEANLYGLWVARLAGIPVRIGEEIGIPIHSKRSRIAMSIAYRAAQKVVGVSDAVKNCLIDSGEVPATKAVRIYNPVGMSDHIAVPRQTGERLRIAFLGRLEPVKNAIGLVRAMMLLPAKVDCELFIIGEGSEKAAIEVVIRSSNLQDRVHMLGFRTMPSSVLSTCHLYVQPSLAEGFGIALAEAMSCALPSIASSSGGMAEIIDHGQTGWLITSVEPGSIAEAICMAESLDPQELAGMGAAARLSVRDRYGPERYLSSLENLYEFLLGEHAAAVRIASIGHIPTKRGNSPRV